MAPAKTYQPTSDERLWAALAHGSALLLFAGFFIPVIVWSARRKASSFVAFRALQAFGYQVLSFLLWMLLSLVTATISLAAMLPALAAATSVEELMGMRSPPISIESLLIFGFAGLYLLLGVVGAVLVGLGRGFFYPFLGSRLARYLDYHPEAATLNDVNEARWVVSMGHAGVIISFWGMLPPLVVWLMEKERSFFLKFQSIQTFIYQLIGNLALLLMLLLYGVGLLGIMFVLGLSGMAGASVMALLVFFFLLLLVMFLIALLLPLYHIMGQVAAVRVLQGRDYNYPVLGKQLRKRLSAGR
ncbi:MAG: DUF4870 domain-containing protein [Anaerolineales bacterium]|nr:DUF4870 domain-containing protein [Anaerolineales bacterium]